MLKYLPLNKEMFISFEKVLSTRIMQTFFYFGGKVDQLTQSDVEIVKIPA